MVKNKKEKLDPFIKTTDEHGKTHTFKLVEIIEYNENEYGLFKYVDPTTIKGKFKNQDDDEIIVMRILSQNDESFFEVIEDEKEFNEIIDYIEEIEDELELD